MKNKKFNEVPILGARKLGWFWIRHYGGTCSGKRKGEWFVKGFFPSLLTFWFSFYLHKSLHESDIKHSHYFSFPNVVAGSWGLDSDFLLFRLFIKHTLIFFFFGSLRNVSSFKSPCHLQHKPMVNHVNIVHHVNGKDKIKIALKLLGRKRHVNFFNLLREKGGANNFFIAEWKELWKLLLSAWALFCLWQKCWPDKFPEFANTMWPKTLPISRSK